MGHRAHNLVTGLQLRAARTLAAMTQKDLAVALGVNERAVSLLGEEAGSETDLSPE